MMYQVSTPNPSLLHKNYYHYHTHPIRPTKCCIMRKEGGEDPRVSVLDILLQGNGGDTIKYY